jgi:hypothetical protein
MGQPYSGPERPATAGTVNTGSGGGGGGSYQNFSNAAAGGSGIVIVRYSDTYQLEVGSGLTHSTVNVNGFNITSFTAGTGNVMFTPIQTSPYAYELLESVVLGGSQSSVTFSNLNSAYGSEYQHLQIRMTLRTTRSNSADFIKLTFNADTTGYARHGLYGNGSSVVSYGLTDIISTVDIPGGSAGASQFGAVVMDILDPFETTKNKTTKSLGGSSGSVSRVQLDSGLWIDTGAISSIKLESGNASEGANLATGSRFSLYGIKAS